MSRIDWTGEGTPAPQKAPEAGIWGWMFFDWAAQPFFTVVTTFIFGPYFVSRLTSDPVHAVDAGDQLLRQIVAEIHIGLPKRQEIEKQFEPHTRIA